MNSLYRFTLGLILLYAIHHQTAASEIEQLPEASFSSYEDFAKFIESSAISGGIQPFSLNNRKFYVAVRDAAFGASVKEVSFFIEESGRYSMFALIPFSLGEVTFVETKTHFKVLRTVPGESTRHTIFVLKAVPVSTMASEHIWAED